jgi:uncharacterized protein YjbJ (UPF0337 family)
MNNDRRLTMNRDRIEGNWKQLRGILLELWGRLVDDTQRESAGLRDQAAGRNQERYGISKMQAEQQLRGFMNRNRNWKILNK